MNGTDMPPSARRGSIMGLQTSIQQVRRLRPKEDSEAFLHEIIESIEADLPTYDHLPDIPFKFFHFYSQPAMTSFLMAMWRYFEYLTENRRRGSAASQTPAAKSKVKRYEADIAAAYGKVLLAVRSLIDMRSLREEERFFEFLYAFVYELLKRHTNPKYAEHLKELLVLSFRGTTFSGTTIGRRPENAYLKGKVAGPATGKSTTMFSSHSKLSPRYGGAGKDAASPSRTGKTTVAAAAAATAAATMATAGATGGMMAGSGADGQRTPGAASGLYALISRMGPKTPALPKQSGHQRPRRASVAARRKSLSIQAPLSPTSSRKTRNNIAAAATAAASALPRLPELFGETAAKPADTRGPSPDYFPVIPQCLNLKNRPTNRRKLLAATYKQSPILSVMHPGIESPTKRRATHPKSTLWRKTRPRQRGNTGRVSVSSRTSSKLSWTPRRPAQPESRTPRSPAHAAHRTPRSGSHRAASDKADELRDEEGAEQQQQQQRVPPSELRNMLASPAAFRTLKASIRNEKYRPTTPSSSPTNSEGQQQQQGQQHSLHSFHHTPIHNHHLHPHLRR